MIRNGTLAALNAFRLLSLAFRRARSIQRQSKSYGQLLRMSATVAKRLAFLPIKGADGSLWETRIVKFEWIPGLSRSQNQRSIQNMHQSLLAEYGLERVLEISSKSDSSLGNSLSAFNLQLQGQKLTSSVECFYQGSKVFEHGGPFQDIYSSTSLQAKRDERLQASGPLRHFVFDSQVWPLEDSPNFYDFLYISALTQNAHSDELLNYDAFTDFAYSQTRLKLSAKKSFNCQARSASIYVTLVRAGKLDAYLRNPRHYSTQITHPFDESSTQLDLFS